jgi:DNA-binding transcriptional LysR family regulator
VEPTDTVLAAAAGQALASGHRFLDHVALRRSCGDRGVAGDVWFRALVDLRTRGLVQMRSYDSQVALLQLTPAGLWAALVAGRDDLDALRQRLLRTIAAADAHAALALGAALGQSPLLVEALLDQLVAEQRVVYSRVGADAFRIHRV